MGIAAAMASWSARHRWAAVGGWLLFVMLAMFIGQSAGRVDLDQDRSMPGEVSQAATIQDDAGLKSAAGEMVLVQSKAGKATDPAFRTAVGDVVDTVRGTGLVTAVTSPYTTKSISADQRSALVRFDLRGDPDTAADRVQPVLDAVEKVQGRHPDLRIEEFGDASADKALNNAFGDDFKTAEYSAVPVALAILLVAFGALVAALLPVALALTAFLAAGGVVAMVSHAVPMSDTANSVMLLVGLAVGVDYCLFYLRREREERAAGHDAETALRIAAATSGRAILISGITVIVAMAGMLFTGIGDFKAMGVATMIVVAIAMFGSVTVLPALLSLLGARVEKGRIPFLGRIGRSAAAVPGAPAAAASGGPCCARCCAARRSRCWSRAAPWWPSPCPPSVCTPRTCPWTRNWATVCRSSRRTTTSTPPSPAGPTRPMWWSRPTRSTRPRSGRPSPASATGRSPPAPARAR